MLSYLLRQEIDLTQKRDQAGDEARTWIGRAKRAYKHGRSDLGAEAKARALDAKAEHDQLQAELDTVKLKLADIRRQAKVRDETESILRAEMMVEAFRLRGILPEEPIPDVDSFEKPDPLVDP